VQEPPWPSPETMTSVSVLSSYFLKYCSLYLSAAESGTLFYSLLFLHWFFCIHPIFSSSAESKLKRRWSLVLLGGIKVLHVHSWTQTLQQQPQQQMTLTRFYHSPSTIVDIIIASLIRLHCFLWISSNQKLWSNKIGLLFNTSVCKLEKTLVLLTWCSRQSFCKYFK